MEDKLLTVEEAAELLRIKPGTLYSWASRGKVPYRKVGSLLRFDREELMQWTVVHTQPKKERRPRLSVVK